MLLPWFSRTRSPLIKVLLRPFQGEDSVTYCINSGDTASVGKAYNDGRSQPELLGMVSDIRFIQFNN